MSAGFAVWQYFPDDTHERVRENVSAEEGVTVAKSCAESVGGRLGTTRRVVIIDDEDFVVFEWKYGEGVVFPPRAAC